MFVPGHNRKLLSSASRSEADVLLLDLEDSVQPLENKALARDLIKEYVNDGAFKNHKVFPRINDRESGELLKDLMELTIDGIDGFVYPKSQTGQDIYFIDKLLETIEYEKGIEPGKFKLIPLIETPGAVLNAQDICKMSDRVIGIAYGCEDYLTALEGIHDADESSLFVPRSMIAMAARACGVIPIDTVHIKVHDLEDLEKNLIIAKNLGFEGMLVLNPKEIPLVHKYFTPDLQAVQDAERMVSLADKASKEGKGVALIDGQFIGPPMLATARKILAKHKLIEAKRSIGNN